MTPKTATNVAIILGALGIILILVGVFTPLGIGAGLLAGIACYILASAVKKMAGAKDWVVAQSGETSARL